MIFFCQSLPRRYRVSFLVVKSFDVAQPQPIRKLSRKRIGLRRIADEDAGRAPANTLEIQHALFAFLEDGLPLVHFPKRTVKLPDQIIGITPKQHRFDSRFIRIHAQPLDNWRQPDRPESLDGFQSCEFYGGHQTSVNISEHPPRQIASAHVENDRFILVKFDCEKRVVFVRQLDGVYFESANVSRLADASQDVRLGISTGRCIAWDEYGDFAARPT